MVLLTIFKQKNGETVYLDTPIPQVHFMKLISSSLYNNWHTLKREGSAELGVEKILYLFQKYPPGHYTLESLAKVINDLFHKYGYRQLEGERKHT